MRTKLTFVFAVIGLLMLSLSTALTRTSQDEIAALVPNRVLVGSANRTDSTTSRSYVELVPTPGQVFTTREVSTIIVQFTGYARLSQYDRAMDIRAVVDGVPVNPGGMRFSGTGFTTISYAGFLSNVSPGRHTVTMQWQVTGGIGYMGSRTFIVWVAPQ